MKPTPHVFVVDPDAAHCCLRCRCVDTAWLHRLAAIAEFEAQQAQREAELAAAQAVQRRWVGDE